MLIVSSLGSEVSTASLALQTIFKGVVAIALLFAIGRYLLPKLTTFIARSQEFLLLFSITWCFAIASIFYALNLSIEAGALLAGVALSMSPYHFEMSSKLRPLRDFFLVLFFVVLGSQMIFANIVANIWIILGFSAFVLIGNPIIVMIIMGVLGYSKRTGFKSGLTVAQISEFSLIVIGLGVSVGHLTNDTLSLLTAVGIITFAGSTYMIMYSEKLYKFLEPYLSIF